MSISGIRAAFENKLQTMEPLATAYEGRKFTPSISTPYQIINLLLAEPENPVVGNGMYRQVGVFQVTLKYPSGRGVGVMETRAEAIRTAFYRGLTISYGDTDVIITKTADIKTLPSDKTWSVCAIKIRFYSEIFT